MKIISFCNPRNSFSEEVIKYTERIKPFSPVDIIYCKSPNFKKAAPENIKKAEEQIIKRKLGSNCRPVAMSEEGRTFSSRSFAQWLSRIKSTSGEPAFIIGGAFGISDSMKRECRDIISLSPMTFNHRICTVVLLEQIYRAYTILNGHPYHK